MPKLKKLEFDHRNPAAPTAELWVKKDGTFELRKQSHPEIPTFSGPVAEEVERKWREATKEFLTRNTTTRKVIVINFCSNLLKHRTDFFRRESQLNLQAEVAEEKTTTTGVDKIVKYRHHPDYSGLHKSSPIPFRFRADMDNTNWRGANRENFLVVEWTQEREDAIVNACNAMQSIAERLDEAFSDERSFTHAIRMTGLLALPAATD